MRLISLMSSVCLLVGCNARTRGLVETFSWILLGVLTVSTIAGLFALRATIRALRQPDGHAVTGSVTALFVLALPMWFIIPIIDAKPQWHANTAIAACALYSAFLFFCFVLSLVRWVRLRA